MRPIITMRIASAGVACALLAAGTGAARAQSYRAEQPPEARVWLDRGDDPVLKRGDRVRVYYRTSRDAYVAIFHIDTDGAVTLLHPRAPGEEHYTRASRDYRLLFPLSPDWYVDEYPGKGYFFMVASPEPFDLSGLRYAHYDRSWDLTNIGRTAYQDPYLAIDDYVGRIVPDWETVPYAIDFISYDVGETHAYPRFLCYDCHGFKSYPTWNPYTYACATYRVVIWDDPYYYPATRYQGTRVVLAASRRGVPRFEFKERASGESWLPLTRRRAAAPPAVQYREPSAAPAIAPAPTRVVPALPRGEDRPVLERRASPPPAETPPPGRTRVVLPARPSEADAPDPPRVSPPSSRARPGTPSASPDDAPRQPAARPGPPAAPPREPAARPTPRPSGSGTPPPPARTPRREAGEGT